MDNDSLNNRKRGTVRANLQLRKIIEGIPLGPKYVLGLSELKDIFQTKVNKTQINNVRRADIKRYIRLLTWNREI